MSDDATPPEDAQPAEIPPHLTARNFESVIDQKIARAMAEGQFNQLAGVGKPQATGDDANVPDELRLAFRMLKSNDFAPPWIEARKDIERQRNEVARWLAEAKRRWAKLPEAGRVRLRTEYHEQLRDLHRTILNHNLTLPPGVPQIANIRMQDELDRLEG